jgi:hypothetical protein
MKLVKAVFVENVLHEAYSLGGVPTSKVQKVWASKIVLVVELNFEVFEVPTWWEINGLDYVSDWHVDCDYYFPRLEDLEDFSAGMSGIMQGWVRPYVDPVEIVGICAAVSSAVSSECVVERVKKYLTRAMVRDHSGEMIHIERKKGEDLFFQTHERPSPQLDEDGFIVGDFPRPFTC